MKGKWQDISTAPKDGTEILGWREDCGIILIRYDCPENFLTEKELAELDEETCFKCDWFAADFVEGCRMEGSGVPEMWMDLPEEPNVV